MADVTGPLRTLPGSAHSVPEGTMCDDHPDRPAYKRVQGETDSFGSEMIDWCEECYDNYRSGQETADKSGHCDWCKQHKDIVRPHRDFEEGSRGPVYKVCSACIQAETVRLQEELADLDDGPIDDHYDFDPGDEDAEHMEEYDDRPNEHHDDETFDG